MAAGSLTASAEPTGSGCAQPTAQLPPETPTSSSTKLPAWSRSRHLAGSVGQFGDGVGLCGPRRCLCSLCSGLNGSPMRDTWALPGQLGLCSWTALLRCQPPLGPFIPSYQPNLQPGENQAQGRGASGEGQVMSLIDLLGSSICHPAEVKVGSGQTGRTPLRLLVLHCSQDWGPRQSGVRPNGRGSVTNPSGSAGPQWASVFLPGLLGKHGWGPEAREAPSVSSHSSLCGLKYPYSLTRTGHPGCFKYGFK